MSYTFTPVQTLRTMLLTCMPPLAAIGYTAWLCTRGDWCISSRELYMLLTEWYACSALIVAIWWELTRTPDVIPRDNRMPGAAEAQTLRDAGFSGA